MGEWQKLGQVVIWMVRRKLAEGRKLAQAAVWVRRRYGPCRGLSGECCCDGPIVLVGLVGGVGPVDAARRLLGGGGCGQGLVELGGLQDFGSFWGTCRFW